MKKNNSNQKINHVNNTGKLNDGSSSDQEKVPENAEDETPPVTKPITDIEEAEKVPVREENY